MAADEHDAAVDELVEVYRAISGEHDDWDDYRAAMVREQRVVVRLTPTRAYGACAEGARLRVLKAGRSGERGPAPARLEPSHPEDPEDDHRHEEARSAASCRRC